MKEPIVGFARRLRREQSDAERNLWAVLRNGQVAGVKFRRQQPIGKYIVDFVTFDKKLIIELDGSQHSQSLARNLDAQRTKWLESQGFRVLRFWDSDVLMNLEGVYTKIEEAMK